MDGHAVPLRTKTSIQWTYRAGFVYKECFWVKQQLNKEGETRGKSNFQDFHELNSL